MPAKHPRLAAMLALALSLVVAAPASALQPPDFRTVDLVPGPEVPTQPTSPGLVLGTISLPTPTATWFYGARTALQPNL